jgi:hypothetical protein
MPKKDKINETDIDITFPLFGGGFVPPGAPANAVAVVARRVAERARVRKVRDMRKAPGRRCAPQQRNESAAKRATSITREIVVTNALLRQE